MVDTAASTRRIAGRLWKPYPAYKDSGVEWLGEIPTDWAVEPLREKRAALISRAVTRGLDPDAPMKNSGVKWLGETPSHWQIAPVYARYAVQLGKMLDEKRISGENLASYLRNIDVQWDRIDTI